MVQGGKRWVGLVGLWLLLWRFGSEAQVPRDPFQFEAEIRRFAALDHRVPPPTNAVVFVGSSSIRLWTTLETDFRDLPAINRGFGGAHFSDINRLFDWVILPYRPRLIVLYAGDNDLADGKTVDTVFADWTTLCSLIRQKLPGTPVGIISVKPSPGRAKFLPLQHELNTRIRAACEAQPDLHFIDVHSAMLNGAGQPRPELFGPDQIHLNGTGYRLWREIITRELGPTVARQDQTPGQSFVRTILLAGAVGLATLAALAARRNRRGAPAPTG